DLNLDPRARRLAAFERIECVADEVDDHPAELFGIGLHRPFAVDLTLHFDAHLLEAIAKRLERGVDYVGGAHVLHCYVFVAGEASPIPQPSPMIRAALKPATSKKKMIVAPHTTK